MLTPRYNTPVKVCLRLHEPPHTNGSVCYTTRGIYSAMFLECTVEFPRFKATKNTAL